MTETQVDLRAAAQTVERLVRERAHKKALNLKWEFPEGLPLVTTDERVLQQILINLVTNAIKFTADRGRITVAARIDANGGMAVSVSDTGIGMRPEDIAIALKPFGQVTNNLTAPAEGTGLGLPLCQRFAEALGGSLKLDSVFGQGTTVTLKLPAASIVPQEHAAQRAAVA